MKPTEFVIHAKVRGAAAIYLSALRDGTQDLHAFITGIEDGVKHRAPFDTAARALALAIFQAESTAAHDVSH
ncbi:MAG: hypothetical protein EPN70_06030 [Paraburkholderia sp.]|uniref:hypothetical protein n=1 Tax=Paraburkholderia sp. TaxID=1926495 RepID=UPI001206AFF2|nr:hypothetical protein [Paraburkholderia sp.]TAM06401.1 MAG: hypothetical protein EPN70_06030 [Paraburkholderia sp.]